MHLALTDEQLELQSDVAGLLRRPGGATGPDGGRPDYVDTIRRMGSGRLARHRVAGGVRRARPGSGRPDDLRRGVPLGRGPPAPAHPQQRGPGHHAARHRRTEGALPPGHPAGRGPLLDRLHRAHRRHRPGVAAHPGRPRRRRVRHQRREALHQRHPVRRLRVAGRPHRPGRPEAQGPLGLHRAGRRPGFSWTPLPTMAGEFTSSTFYEDVRVPAATWSARRTVAGRSSPTSSTSSGWPSARCRASCAHRRGPRLGPGGACSPTAAG